MTVGILQLSLLLFGLLTTLNWVNSGLDTVLQPSLTLTGDAYSLALYWTYHEKAGLQPVGLVCAERRNDHIHPILSFNCA
jgi:hypothetical protein